MKPIFDQQFVPSFPCFIKTYWYKCKEYPLFLNLYKESWSFLFSDTICNQLTYFKHHEIDNLS